MTFNPDGRTLLCGLHESLKVPLAVCLSLRNSCSMNCGICVVPLTIFLCRFARGNQLDVMIQ